MASDEGIAIESVSRFDSLWQKANKICQVEAPGRVNLIGEHVDYAGGQVLPFCIDRSITLTWGNGSCDDQNMGLEQSILIKSDSNPQVIVIHWQKIQSYFEQLFKTEVKVESRIEMKAEPWAPKARVSSIQEPKFCND